MRWLVVALVAGCSGNASAPPKPVPMDAPAVAVRPAPTEWVRPPSDDHRPPPQANRVGRPIDVILRSTPQNADVSVDGVNLGSTPAYWNGMADGREHEFVFVLPGHAVARYRFVPITSGVIHARLEPINDDQGSGFEAPAPMTPTPMIPAPVAPTVIDGPSPIAPVVVPAVVPDAAPSIPSTGLGPQN